jgi:hypothetical protein
MMPANGPRATGRRARGQRAIACPVVSAGKSESSAAPFELACGMAAGPLFVGGFTAIGASRARYDWRRHAVSSLASGHAGWLQRANFVLTGTLYCIATRGLARSPEQGVAAGVIPALVFGVGAGLVGSGLFVTDPVAGFPPGSPDTDRADGMPSVPTREGMLHNLCAIPIFAGIPTAATMCAATAARRGESRWATYSAGSALGMMLACARFGAAFGGAPRLAGHGGLWQRISIAAGFGWLTVLSFRALTLLGGPRRT